MPKPRAAIIPVTPFEQNCTLVWDEETLRGAVVDPGGDLDRIRAAVAKHGVTIEQILLTHGHADHAAGAAELAEALGVPVVGPHAAEAPVLARLVETSTTFGIPARPLTPDRWLAEGDSVAIGGLSFSVLHCPGHSPGSVVFVSADEPFVIMGDVLFRGSIGRTDLPGGDTATLLRAIAEKILPLGDDVAFIPGHGPTSTIGHERRTNPFLQGNA